MTERAAGGGEAVLTSIKAWAGELLQPMLLANLGVILLALLAGMLIARRVRTAAPSDSTRHKLLRTLALPVATLLLLGVGRFVLRHYGYHLPLSSIAAQLALVMVGLRLAGLALGQVFAESTWLRTAVRYLTLVVWVAVALNLFGILPELIEWLDEMVIPVGKNQFSLWVLIKSVLTIGVMMVAMMWLGDMFDARLQRSATLDSSLRAVLARVMKALMIFIGILVSLSIVGIDLTALSVFSGAVGIGLGFGMQKVMSNYVAGFIILLDRSIRIGNMISVGSDRGEVLEITTRYTVLKAPSGLNVIVPNETLIGSVVQNETYIDRNLRISIAVQVAYATDIDEAMRILEECALIHERVLRDPPPTAFLVAFADSGINLELGLWIFDPLQGSLEIRSNINREIWRRFQAAGIEIPFPQRELRLRSGGEVLGELAKPAN